MDKELDLAVTCYGKVKPLKYGSVAPQGRRTKSYFNGFTLP